MAVALNAAADIRAGGADSLARTAQPLNPARQAAQDFEAVYLNTMFQQMFTGVDGEGPFGGGAGASVWRSFLTDEYARTFAKAGGVGIADHVYRTLMAQQEVATR